MHVILMLITRRDIKLKDLVINFNFVLKLMLMIKNALNQEMTIYKKIFKIV